MSVKMEDYYPREKYQEHLLEQYKLYVTLADQISQRRMTTNTFFMSANTLLTTIGAAFSKDTESLNSFAFTAYAMLFLVGILISVLWCILLDSYQKLNSRKYKVVAEMEKKLPYAPYDEEWKNLSARNKPHFSQWEKRIPITFCVLYVVLLSVLVFPVMINGLDALISLAFHL